MIDFKEIADRAENDRGGVYPNPKFPPSIYYRFLKYLAQEMKPKLSVELGLCGGGGSLHLALGHPEGKVIGVDLAIDYPKNLEYLQNNYSNFTFLQEDSSKAAKIINKKVDILFIDTDHTYERTMLEFNSWRPYLRKRSVVCFDDLLRDGMTEAWEELPGKKIRLDRMHDGSGFGVIYGL